MASNDKFEKAVLIVRGLNKKLNNEDILQLYAFFKQAREGNIAFERPSILNMRGRAMWGAWNKIKNMSKEAAMIKYIKLAYKLTELEELKLD